ncbi:hypothetical protein B0T11DRAFT_54510 [Plectosphaerella cucumerina]|uniref:Uncharacterized protein n=1 Tax=Plectosphaerella cucumerina TaxID=40658 RepID=A0A8K0X727_9PEZI|nr:hypothetical protein B0T11DRAFT_54510 [Plectosphaerella cucumerina]
MKKRCRRAVRKVSVATACRLTTDVLALWLCSQRTADHMAGMSGLAVIESPRYADETEACGHAESVSRPCHIRKVLPSRRFRGQPHRLATKGSPNSDLHGGMLARPGPDNQPAGENSDASSPRLIPPKYCDPLIGKQCPEEGSGLQFSQDPREGTGTLLEIGSPETGSHDAGPFPSTSRLRRKEDWSA